MRRETRPWGRFEVISEDEKRWMKYLYIFPGQSLSLQKHEHRTECWRLQYGKGVMFSIDGFIEVASPTKYYIVSRGVEHRILNAGQTEACVLEWAYGDVDEDDIVRMADNYGRA